MRKIFISALVFGVLVLGACSSEANESESGFNLRLGVTQNSENAEYIALEEFKDGVEERTNGDVEIELYHSDQLASVPDLVEQASVGTNVGTISDAAMLGDLKQEFSILQSPYVFDGYDEIDKFLESDVFSQWSSDFTDQGLQILSFNFRLGERNLATTSEVTSPEDLNGNVIRTSGARIANETVEAMGAASSGMPWTEAYSGLEQGVIDGVEAHNLAIYESSMYEVIDYITKTNHYQLLSALVISAEWFNQLPEEYQEIVIEEAESAGESASEIASEKSDEYELEMEESGVEFIDVDREEFKNLTLDIFEELNLEDTRTEVVEVLENE